MEGLALLMGEQAAGAAACRPLASGRCRGPAEAGLMAGLPGRALNPPAGAGGPPTT